MVDCLTKIVKTEGKKIYMLDGRNDFFHSGKKISTNLETATQHTFFILTPKESIILDYSLQHYVGFFTTTLCGTFHHNIMLESSQ